MSRIAAIALALIAVATTAPAQDSVTGEVRGVVEDPGGARIAGARVVLTDSAHGTRRERITDAEGAYRFPLLPPGAYAVQVVAEGMAPFLRDELRVELGGTVDLNLRLRVASAAQSVDVAADAGIVQTRPSAVAGVIAEQEIDDLPLNGRRFTDLVLLTPGVTQDPRGLTSSSNGDLAFAGMRGWQTSYLVDGADNNNSFFAQARGRYRAPYQFSNETVQEFRVSSNSYGAELGRAGGGVVNIVTRSGSNFFHGTGFYYLRDNSFAARHPFVNFKPEARQHQLGGTIGGPIRKNRAFFYAGFDQHSFDIPTVVRFRNGYSTVAPAASDFEYADYALVSLAAKMLSQVGGTFRSRLIGNAGMAKLDINLSPRYQLTLRANRSRYWGANNVFFDPSSPITFHALSENGEEVVATESGMAALTSAPANWLTSQFRAQFSRDLQESFANADWPRVRIADVIDGFGRSSILPRRTREHRLHLTETLTAENRRHEFKLGGDLLKTWIYNFFPSMFGGMYTFEDMRVNPFTFEPQVYGMKISPLRAYAHSSPRYYSQNFGTAVAHPDTDEYSAFAQDTVRFGEHLAVSAGVRWDMQTFRTDRLVSNYFFRASGRVPVDENNVAPRLGLGLSLGHARPLVIRGGAGLFYTRIPSIYNSTIETDNGARNLHLFLDRADSLDRGIFPEYPAPLVKCALYATECEAPGALQARMSSDIAAFAPDFQIPFVQQASLSMEREVAARTAVNVSYLYSRGHHLVRARDVNLPKPVLISYPVFDETGSAFTGQYYTVESFSQWEVRKSATCSYPPCLSPLERPYPQLGSVTVFESAATSEYQGVTVSARRRMHRGFAFRVAYTWARAMDDGQDALVAGRPATVQNSYSPQGEWGASVVDQRHRFVTGWTADPKPFHRDHPWLRTMFNDWRLSGVLTFGTGRPLNARIVGDSNRDGNDTNDRLPGYRRNSFTGPDYMTTDLRLMRTFPIRDRWRLEITAEGFNVTNRNNRRVEISDDGFLGSAATFVMDAKSVGVTQYPAHFRKISGFLTPTNAYAPRQVQFAARLRF